MSTTAELEPFAGGQLEQYQAGLVMTPDQAKALDDQVRACTRAVLRQGVDYGTTPGTSDDTKTLKKPGAEKLLQWFGLAYTMHCLDTDRDAEGRKEGVTYRCTVTKRIGDPARGILVDVAVCEGYAGYDEDKFFQTAEQVQFKAEARERMWAAKDKRPANPNKWKYLTGYRAPWNTVIKMAQKRALVGATIVATAAGGLFSTEEDDVSPPASDGSTWYEQATEAAAAFTDPAAEGKLYVAAAHAARDGLCTPQQASHVQNRIRQRGAQLRKAIPVDVEDLGRQAQDSAPAAPDTEPAAGAAPGQLIEDQPGTASKAQLTKLRTVLTGLGFTGEDREQKLKITETIARRPLAGDDGERSSKNLSWNGARKVIDTLDGMNRDQLIAYMAAQEGGTGG